MSKRILFLDDMEDRHLEFIKMTQGMDVNHVFNAEEAIGHLKTFAYDLVFLDHDLSAEHYTQDGQDHPVNEGTGAEVAEFIATMVEPPNTVVVHSWNSAGTTNMINIMKDKVKNIYREKFGIRFGSFNQLLDELIKE